MAVDEDTVAVTVRDYGVGLRPGEEKLVFSRFWRSDPSRVRRSGGTGLGLAISIEDARLHQGRLEAWGEPGKGACFRLTLPLVRGHKVTTSPLPLKPVGRERKARSVRRRSGNRRRRACEAAARRLWPRVALAFVWPDVPGCPVRRRRRRSEPSTGPHRRACRSRRPAWIPTCCCANSSRRPPIPSNRHLAARQFLTESASSGWDDAGSALLIDRVVFVETRGPNGFRSACAPTSSARCPTSGCSRRARARCPIPARSSW